MSDDRDQELVAALLRATPAPRVPGDFLARVNARIDETAGWLGFANYRAWTLRLVPVAAVLVLLAILWPASSTVTPAAQSDASDASSTVQSFSPSSYSDWQRDVTANALLEAALNTPAEDRRSGVR